MSDFKKAIEKEYHETAVFLFESVNSERTHRKISHYTRAQATNSIFQNRTLRFTRWDFLNDMSEFTYVYSLVRAELEAGEYDRDFRLCLQEISDLHAELQRSTEYPKAEDYYVFSFSFDGDCLPLWSNYAKMNESDGYSLQFDCATLRDSLERLNGVSIFEGCVIYDLEAQLSIVRKMLSSLGKIYSILIESEVCDKIRDIMASAFEEYISIIAGFFKHPSFENEEEFRFVYLRRRDESAIQIKSRVKNGIIIPYADLAFDTSICERVTASPVLNPVVAKNGLRVLREITGSSFEIAASRIPYRTI